jgi:Carboxypeptidase regulatory-like domain
MNTITRAQYNTPKEVLYSVCMAAWNLCSEHRQKFTGLKPLYTSAFVAGAIDAVQAAKQLPESLQTLATCKVARINLTNSNKQVLANWQLLKRYIIRAFDKDLVKTKLEEAGASLYNKAYDDNWIAVRCLIEAANSFIAANLDELTAGENMPPAFQETFLTGGNNCTECSTLFAQANMQRELTTSIKAAANNNIYKAVMNMLKDGQQIFKDDEAVKRQFTFIYLVFIFRGEGSASLKGYATNNLSQPIQGATILSADGKYKATTNAKGHYRISRIAEGTYTFTATCPGYAPIEQRITSAAGTASKANFEMVNQMKKVA